MIDIRKLIKIAPYSKELKDQLLSAVDGFSEDKKFELENLCWDAISQEYHNNLDLELRQKALEKTQQGKPFTPDDVKEIEEKHFKEFLKKLESADAIEQIEEVREKLQQVSSKAN